MVQSPQERSPDSTGPVPAVFGWSVRALKPCLKRRSWRRFAAALRARIVRTSTVGLTRSPLPAGVPRTQNTYWFSGPLLAACGAFRWARALSMAPRRPRHSPRRIAPDLPWSASEHSPRTGPRARIAPPLARGDATRGGPPSLIRRGPRGACCRSDGSRRRRRRRREGCAARRPRRAAGVWWSRSDSVWAAAAPPPPPPSSSPEGERAGGSRFVVR